ncbi:MULTISPECIES: GspE/PulE family protein [Pseudomonas]|uniref:Type II secretory pathway, ATPase PulE/Tfp pilus assembly pathway, ATPase PilB n=1 Tax=Pseudomonas chlororaphis subsp. aureofaciens TaxID=587851 RepID=A0AAD0ZM01_9PSED|nr:MULTISPECIES: GspE/PulE family protein [Pseudomonas]AZD89150.1 Type II secretory pathway, ATPase PulE/Tfp pilus assembly pathway, ATPase PilB [Pseudomonas chlororaphis subsp. aureofaciens]AZE01899.1 Type II secretory pathway, ATPase PulE/Tfp pilus assembly pathway, ATPase PilB [Pseudomonas chlororaphis subsp. aureofaciens]AZE08019.1 Type II secretory pathway, ATPase PulE/Tfp pilus assembly pathway, ATPase PilB [Pseudomonas chlororaphis subsp. aureofaciens]AZE20164.1 Type II secretory pathway
MSVPLVTQDRWLDLNDLLRDLVAQGFISQDSAEHALTTRRNAANSQLHPLEFLASQHLDDLSRPGRRLDLESLTLWLAQQAGQPYLRIDPLKIDVAAVTPLMSYAFAQRHKILAVSIDAEAVTVASAQPYVSAWEADLTHVLKLPIKRVVANPVEIQRLTVEFFRLAKSVTGASADQKSHAPGNFEQLLNLGASDQEPDANDAHIVNIVDWLFQYAFQQRASDIHIEPRREQGTVRFRIDGVLHNVYQFPPQVTMAVVSRLKSLGRMNVAEKRKPQDGRVKTKTPEGGEVELRLSTLPTAFGEKMVMRIFDPEVLLKDFDQLGFSSDDLRRWQEMTRQPNGIILVTGPTGSGKTTTLYTTLKKLATPEVNLCTIEDPIEMVEPAFNQMQVQHNIELTFASGVRALMRQDPDIIMIGEIRDLETAEMAIQAALTGHLVLSTLHTNDAPGAISRLLELGVAPYLIKATLLGVMAQRLVRTLCPHCKTPLTLDEGDWQNLTRPWQAPLPSHAHGATGCLECRDTGYRGRAGVYEIMQLSDSLKALISADADLLAIRRQAFLEGMRSLRLSGAQKVAAGLTTLEEILRVTPQSEQR